MKNSEHLINQNENIIDALNKLNKIKNNSELILFVCKSDMSIIGSLTDGDIRRSISKNKDLYKLTGEICNRNFTFEYKNITYIDLKKLYINDIRMLPILNKDKTLYKLIDLNIYKSILPLECVIMAGGRGKRLSPLTDSTPKPMLKFNKKPLLEYNIDRLISFGIKKIYISVGYLSNKIVSYFGDGSKKGIEIKYIEENKPLGTAGSLSLIKKINTDHLLLINGDIFSNIDFEELYLKLISENADMAISSKDYSVDIPLAVFDITNGKIKNFQEKPTYNFPTNAGVYLLKKEFLNLIPKNKFYQITDLIEKILSLNKKVINCPIRGYWMDIGTPNDYKSAQELFNRIK